MPVNTKKIFLFLAISFGVSWLAALVMYLAGIDYGSLPAIVITALFYMPAPALATLLVQKYIYKESLLNYGLTFRNIEIKFLFVSAAFYLGFVFLTIGLVFLLGNLLHIYGFGEVSFTPENVMHQLSTMLKGKSDMSKVKLPPPFAMFFLGTLSALLSGAIINLPFTFGEEFGWRGLLLKETQSLGFWKCNLLIGCIWGLWHMPIIMMGHNYPGYPISGSIMMIPLCISLSFLLSIVRLRSRTVFMPAALHGMINAGAPVTFIFIVNNNVFIGSIVGSSGIMAALIITAIYLMIDRSFISSFKSL